MSSQLTGTWTVDPDHSRIGFSSRHAMVTKVRGAFNDVAGTIAFDEEDHNRSHVEVTVQMASIDTRSSARDEHLRSADFFDVEAHPEMVFRSSRVEEVDEGGYIVSGDLTIHGITRPMSIPLHFVGVDTDPFGNLRAGFEGTRRIDRREWGVTWNTPLDSGGLLISDRINLEFEMSLIKQSDEVSPAPAAAAADAAHVDADAGSGDAVAVDTADGAAELAEDTGPADR
ncbi:YceI family protein [Brachybacterium kimchii]|uniref:YceI family protein n=1 Tax=Brachybacterium kimchii TaxID=2942909 RepID=UPI003211C759